MNIAIVPVGMLGTNCYVLAAGDKSCAVIDPGAQPDKIAGLIAKNGFAPKYILLTHCHYDHIGGVERLMERFPEAELLMGGGDREMLEGSGMGAMRDPATDRYVLDHAGMVQEGAELALGELTVRVIETPGHSMGGLTFLCGDAMFAGDTLFQQNVGRTDLYGGDYDTLLKSLKKLAELPGDYYVYPGHGDTTTLEFERKHNMYMRESLA